MSFFKNKQREVVLGGIIILISIIIATLSPNFLTKQNIVNVFEYNAIMGVLSYAMMLIILTGNIDISIGANFGLATMLVASYLNYTGGKNWFLAVIIGILSGVIVCGLNGLIISIFKIPSIVVTLGMMNIIRGVLYEITQGAWSNRVEGNLAGLVNKRVLDIPLSVYIWIISGFILYFILFRLKFGRNVLAVGGNRVAAKRIGINTELVTIFSYILAGVFVGLGAVMSVSKLKSAQPSGGQNYDMNLIAAVVIGGTTFAGGEGSIVGTFLGVLLMSLLDNGLILTQTPLYWQQLTTGIIIIMAVISSVISLDNSQLKKSFLPFGKVEK